VFEKINHVLVIADRERVGREVSYFASIIDSQGVKTTEAGAPARRSLSLGRLSAGSEGHRMKIYGRKCQALIATDGRPPPR
jgi:hypothetical protein